MQLMQCVIIDAGTENIAAVAAAADGGGGCDDVVIHGAGGWVPVGLCFPFSIFIGK